MNQAATTIGRVGPIVGAYYQAVGRPDGISENWEDDGVSYGLFLSRRRKKAWVLAVGARRGSRGHTVSVEFDHRPTMPDIVSAVFTGRVELLAKLGVAKEP